MSRAIKVATASINTVALNIKYNIELIQNCIQKASQQDVDLLLLPELAICGYGCEDMFLVPTFIKQCWQALLTLISQIPSQSMLVAVGLPIWFEEDKCLYNACALITKDKILGIACKQALAKEGVHYEPRWFTSWPAETVKSIVFNDDTIPVGELLIEVNGIRLGFEICEDAWVNNRLGNRLAESGLDILLNPSASHFAIAKHATRLSIVGHAAKEFDCIYAYCNLIGCEAGRMIYDGGNMIACYSDFVSFGPRFCFMETHLNSAIMALKYKRHSVPKVALYCYQFPDFLKNNHRSLSSIQPLPSEDKLSVTFQALALGMWDWQRKTHQKGFVISLSGGADSALCACIVFLAHQLAQKKLGQAKYKQVMTELGIDGNRPIMSQVLTTVYQQSDNSSELTSDAAKTLALALGAKHFQWQIGDEVRAFEQKIQQCIGRKLNWSDDDIARQNIQARLRAPGIWMLANIEQKLLLATSNLSEASVGYCTMDGDTAGVMAPIGGISKTLVLALNTYLCRHGLEIDDERIIVPALEAIINQIPTAELRPEAQQDEQDLMPYEILDAIRSLAQVSRLMPDEIVDRLNVLFKAQKINKDQIKQYVEKYFRLYSRNQWKRERLAVSFHIEQDSACPKTYRRYPVLTG